MKEFSLSEGQTRSGGCWWEFWIYTRGNIVVHMSGVAFNLSSCVLMRKSSRQLKYLIHLADCILILLLRNGKWKFIALASDSIPPKGFGMRYNGFKSYLPEGEAKVVTGKCNFARICSRISPIVMGWRCFCAEWGTFKALMCTHRTELKFLLV